MDKYGIIGYPLGHTFSPQIHNPAFKALAIKAVYEKFQISPETFATQINGLKEGLYKGFNVTIPYKQQVIPFIDEIDALASKVNAVNTIKKINGKWHGFNTDLYGFLVPLKNELQHIKNVLVIGAGGAANAVCFALADATGVTSLTIANRTVANAEALKSRLNQHYHLPVQTIPLDKTGDVKYDLVVNTSNVGMGSMAGESPFDLKQSFKKETIVYDLIYNPQRTELLKQAESLELKAINGLDMLIGQAEKSFFIWTGQEFPGETIDKAMFYR